MKSYEARRKQSGNRLYMFNWLKRSVDPDVLDLHKQVNEHPFIHCVNKALLFAEIYNSIPGDAGKIHKLQRLRQKNALWEMLDCLDVIQYGKTGERNLDKESDLSKSTERGLTPAPASAILQTG